MENERLVETVDKARQGDRGALRDLYLDMYKNVYFLAFRIVKIPEDAEDITQEVYITMQQKIAGLREPTAFFGWISQITANKCYCLLRNKKGISWIDGEEVLQDIEDDDPANLPDKAIDDEATREIILEVIDNLPDAQRVCVLLYYYAQNTITEIADTLETNENTVKSRLSAARAKIRAALEEKEKKEGIKLWGIPLSLTEILRESFENFDIPSGAESRFQHTVSEATEPPDNIVGGSPGPDSQHCDGSPDDEKIPETDNTVTSEPDSMEIPGADNTKSPGTGSAEELVAKAVKKAMPLTTKIIIGIIAAVMLVAGIIIISQPAGSTLEASPSVTIDGEETTPDGTNSPETAVSNGPEETAQPEPPEDESTVNIEENDKRAPTPIDLRLGVISWDEPTEDAVCWDIPGQNERVKTFELSVAAVGSEEWVPLLTWGPDYRELDIGYIAAHLDEGEYRLSIKSLPKYGYEPSEPAYFENWTLIVKTGGSSNTGYSFSVFEGEYGGGEMVRFNGFDEDFIVFYTTKNYNGEGRKNITAFYNVVGEAHGTKWLYTRRSYAQPGDVFTIRELISIENNGTNHTVTFMKTSDPIIWP